MADLAAVPMLVLARTQDSAAAIDSTLRNAGLPAHCTWISETKDLGEALANGKVEMLLAFVGPEGAELKTIVRIRDQAAPGVPVIAVRDRVDEDIIALAMQMGARDAVTLRSRARLQAVVARELQAYRTQRELAATRASAQQHKEQMKAIMSDVADAIAYVQEGILVDANPAWLKLFGHKSADSMVSLPLMDFLHSSAHGAFKTAMVACLQGKWNGQSLRANAMKPDQSIVPFDFVLARAEFDGEPAVRLSIPAKTLAGAAAPSAPAAAAKPAPQPPAPPKAPAAAKPAPKPAPKAPIAPPPVPPPLAPKTVPVKLAPPPAPPPMSPDVDATTGFLQRRAFSERLHNALTHQLKAGVRQIVVIEPDDLTGITGQLGPLGLEEYVGQLAAFIADTFKPGDIIGRMGDCTFAALLERGTPRDVESWANALLGQIAANVFNVAGKSVLGTCSIGIGMVDLRAKDANAPLSDAMQARRNAHASGGNKFALIDRSDEDTRRLAADAIWVRMVKSALMENRFKLLQQPIANLVGEERGMMDVLVRMVDESGEDVLPSEFMAAAERNDLMKGIDRWVIGSAITVCASRSVSRMFVRISKTSVCDKSLPDWLDTQTRSAGIEASRIVFQVPEPVLAEHLSEASAAASALRQMGFKFCVEHFGSGRDSLRLLTHVPVDYVKIDGALMQSVAKDKEIQSRIKLLVDGARNRKIATIAERVEDANTMAILWQLGIEYILGYFVNEPEQVTMGET